MESLRPIEHNELTEAADLIENFQSYWGQCGRLENPGEARKRLVEKIVERVFVRDGDVLAVVLHGGFSVISGKDEQEKEAIAEVLEIKMGYECTS